MVWACTKKTYEGFGRKVGQMGESPITYTIGRPKKIIGKTISKDFYIYKLIVNMYKDRTHRCQWICIADPI